MASKPKQIAAALGGKKTVTNSTFGGSIAKQLGAAIGGTQSFTKSTTGGSIAKQLASSIGGIQPIIKSTPMSVDVSAEGMKKKSTALKGTTVSYSGIKTSSQGLLTGAKTEKKTLLGG